MYYKFNHYLYYDNDETQCLILNLYNGTMTFLHDEEIKLFDQLRNKEKFEFDKNNKEFFKKLLRLEVILNENTNEIDCVLRRFYDQQNENKLHITIFVTEKCNFNCSYCFVNRENAVTISHTKIDEIFHWIVKRTEQFEYKEIDIAWFGGEPLLATTEVFYFLSLIKPFCERRAIKLSNSMVSNGYLLNLTTFIKLYKEGINCIQVTFDGDEKLHNSQRISDEKQGTFKIILRNLLAIKKLPLDNFFIIVRCNYSKNVSLQQEESIKAFIEQFKQYFGSDRRFQLQIKPIVEYNQWGNGVEFQTYIGNLSYLINKSEFFPKFESEIFSQIMPKKAWCPVFDQNNLTIDARGDVYLCDAVISKKKYKIGEFKENGDLLIEKDIKGDQEKHLSERCKSCRRLPICMGSCYLIKKEYGKNACFCNDAEIHKILRYFLKKNRRMTNVQK